MQIGRFNIEQLSEGQFEMHEDGKVHKLSQEELNKKSAISHLTGPRSPRVGIDPVLIRGENANILLDTGMGWGLDKKTTFARASNIRSNLAIFGLEPEDITHVVLTHLHYDHAAGSTFINDDSQTEISFPNASYYVQKREWEFAIERHQTENSEPGIGYRLDELYRLFSSRHVQFITTDYFKVIPGIQTILTGGHTPGHQIVRISDADRTAYYFGDLVPSDAHLNQYSMQQLDWDPEQARDMKLVLLRQAFSEKAYLLFYHALYKKSGRIKKDSHRKYILRD